MRLRINLNNVEGEFMATIAANPFEGFEDGATLEVTIKGKFHRGQATRLPYLGEYIVPEHLVQFVRLLEPVYEVGEIYVSKEQNAYYRLPDQQWRHCKSGTVYEDTMPTRPMRKLTVQ